jgi:phage baseplate assembly protein W
MTTITPLGRGLALSAGDLVLLNGDFVEIAGRDNFLQGMQVMIETPFASDIFNINYGFDIVNILSQPQPPGFLKELIRLNVVKSLSTDNRVAEIREIAFSDEARFFEIAPDNDPDETQRQRRLERRWQAVVVLHTISEGEVALRLDGQGG